MSAISVPFHFTATFLVTLAAAAAAWVAVSRPDYSPKGRSSRPGFILGWSVLALGEVVHGSLIAPAEFHILAASARSGAYALLVYALLFAKGKPSSRQTSAAAIVVTPGALMPVVLGASTALYALRSALPEARRLAAGLGGLALSEVLFAAGGAEVAIPGAAPGLLWFVAHGVRLAGGVFIGTWLWGAMKSSIRFRFVGVFVGMLVLVVVIISGAMTSVFSSNVTADALDRAASAGLQQQLTVREREGQALKSARSVAQVAGVRDQVARRSGSLGQLAVALQQPGGLFDTNDFLAFVDARGNPPGALLAISSVTTGGENTLSDADAIALVGTDVVLSALQGTEAASVDSIGASSVGVVAAYPVFALPGTEAPGAPQIRAGAVVLGNVFNNAYLFGLPGIDEDDQDQVVSLVNRNEVISTTLISSDPQALITDHADDVRRTVFERGGVLNARNTIDGIEYFSSYVPLERTDNEVVGALVVSQRSEVLAVTQANVAETLYLVSLLVAGLAFALAQVSGTRFTQPIRKLTEAALAVREGKLDATTGVTGSDEVGVLGGAFDDMTRSVAKLTGDLRSTAEQLDVTIQSMADALVAVDADGKVTVINHEAERLLGMSSAEVLGLPISEVLTITDPSGEEIKVALYELKEGRVRGWISRSGGPGTPVSLTSSTITSIDGAVVGAVGVLRDLSREMELEKMKSEFLSNISHELRTPLTPIRGYTEMLKRKPVPRRQAVKFLQSIYESTHRLERIVDMLVDFAAMDAGRLVPQKTEVDLDRITARLVKEWEKVSQKHTFVRRGFGRLPTVSADEKLMPRAINELIDNAVKFSPKGGRITIQAEVETSVNGAGTVRISVLDKGMGISRKDLKRVFEDFTQVDPSETREFGGLGLGLSYVRQIVDGHSGKLEATSRKGGGSRFTIVLPKSAVAQKGTRASRSKSISPKSK